MAGKIEQLKVIIWKLKMESEKAGMYFNIKSQDHDNRELEEF